MKRFLRERAPGTTVALLAALTTDCAVESRDAIESLALKRPSEVIDAGQGSEAVTDEGRSDGGTSWDENDRPAVTKVTANGTGCPVGTWDTVMRPDDSFDLETSAYEASVDAQTSVAVKSGQLTVKLHSPCGQSLAVDGLVVEGEVFLEEGVRARQVMQLYNQGDPVMSEQIRGDLLGPVDDFRLRRRRPHVGHRRVVPVRRRPQPERQHHSASAGHQSEAQRLHPRDPPATAGAAVEDVRPDAVSLVHELRRPHGCRVGKGRGRSQARELTHRLRS